MEYQKKYVFAGQPPNAKHKYWGSYPCSTKDFPLTESYTSRMRIANIDYKHERNAQCSINQRYCYSQIPIDIPLLLVVIRIEEKSQYNL